MEESEAEICRRIAKIRAEMAGARGKSTFAKQLGLSPSTYSYYESSRVPPADILVRIADRAGVDLRWLLTGQASSGATLPASHPVIQRAARLLADRPGAAEPLAAFLDILTASAMFPQKSGKQELQPAAGGADEQAGELPGACWIPVLGRCAAGVSHFWAAGDDTANLTSLNDLIARHAAAGPRKAQAAEASGEQVASAKVQLIILTEPRDEVSQFIAAPGLKAGYPDAFAVQIDGQSMAPDLRHGDLAILSPTRAAQDGRPAVVQLKGQIGVTCKIYRRQGDRVHLIPVNDQFSPAVHPADEVVWALRVLARVRPSLPGGAGTL